MAAVTAVTVISQYFRTVIYTPAGGFKTVMFPIYLKTDLQMCGFVKWKATESMKNLKNAVNVN